MKLDKKLDIFTCPVCGKTFIKTSEWIYKHQKSGGSVEFYCRYNCYRSAVKDYEENKKNKKTYKSKRTRLKPINPLRKYNCISMTDEEVDFCIEYAKNHSIEKTKRALFENFGTKCSNQTIYTWARGIWKYE